MAVEVSAVIVGAGPSGLATSACLNRHGISNLVLEREDCYASLWRNRTYDRLGLHLAREFCTLPYMEYPSGTPTYVPKKDFIAYLDAYVRVSHVSPKCSRSVESASYDKIERKWTVRALNSKTGAREVYSSEFLVVATGENGEGFVPRTPGLESFRGDVLHSSQYKSGLKYRNKKGLVVGCGNSGMEISYDLASYGCSTSIVVRSPFHFLSKGMVHLGMVLLNYLPVSVVDALVTFLSKIKFGDLSSHGVCRPKEGPFILKVKKGRSPVIDVGTIEKIRSGEIQVVPVISKIDENTVEFEDGTKEELDVIVFATGYRSTATKWLKNYDYCLNKEGMPKNGFPLHWKGENGLYCAGLSRMGLAGISDDAKAIADHIKLEMDGSDLQIR